jgi:hypothetical protein
MQPPKETHMAAAPKTTKLVKIKALRDIRLTDGSTVLPGQVVEVPEADAKEFCDLPTAPAHYAFSGERPQSEVVRHDHKRAVRL